MGRKSSDQYVNTQTVREILTALEGRASIAEIATRIWEKDPDEAIDRYATFERLYKRVTSILIDHPRDFQRFKPGIWTVDEPRALARRVL